MEQLLTPTLAQLFTGLERSEQAHAIRVCRKLIEQGETDAPLLTAALLHDIGKTHYRLQLWERVWIVLFEWLRKKFKIILVLEDKDLEKVTWWKRCLVVGKFHPLWGAELLRELGVDEQVVWLVQHHQGTDALEPTDPKMIWLRKLERADRLS